MFLLNRSKRPVQWKVVTVTLEFGIFPVLFEVYFVVHGMLMDKRRLRTVLLG